MRLMARNGTQILMNGACVRATVRPLSIRIKNGAMGQDNVGEIQLLVPIGMVCAPGDTLTISGAPYVVTGVRRLVSHLQLQARRMYRRTV